MTETSQVVIHHLSVSNLLSIDDCYTTASQELWGRLVSVDSSIPALNLDRDEAVITIGRQPLGNTRNSLTLSSPSLSEFVADGVGPDYLPQAGRRQYEIRLGVGQDGKDDVTIKNLSGQAVYVSTGCNVLS